MSQDAKAFAEQLETFAEQLVEGVRQATRETAEALADRARARTPVRTGRLRRGWQVVANGPAGLRVENVEPYAETVELGTRERPGAHMLGLAVQEVRNSNR